jgi:anti-sigma B factor antagonist
MNAQVKTLVKDKVAVVSFEGDIDFSVLVEMHKAIDEALASKLPWVLVDLSAVTFIASDGLGVLIEAHRKTSGEGRKIDLIHPQPHILGMLRKTQLTRLFHVYETVEAALAAES